MSTKGIDISKWQGSIDFTKVKAAGVQFAILRAGYGSNISYKDKYFETYYAGAKAVGIPVGAYWYSYATSVAGAKAEAQVCLQAIKGKQFEYPIYFDIEDASARNLGKQTLTEMCKAFCDVLENAGYFVGVYANTDWFTNRLDHAALSKEYTIWLADYRANYNKALKRDMHQYTSSGKVNGIAGNVDMNTCTVDFPGIIKKVGLNGYTKQGQPTIPKKYDINLKDVSADDMQEVKELAEKLKLNITVTEK